MYNKIILDGRISKMDELKQTAQGKAMLHFTLAVDYGKEKKTEFFRLSAFSTLAEAVYKHRKVGDGVMLESSWEGIEDYTDKNGNHRYNVNLIADKVIFTEGKKKDEAPVMTELKEDEQLPF